MLRYKIKKKEDKNSCIKLDPKYVKRYINENVIKSDRKFIYDKVMALVIKDIDIVHKTFCDEVEVVFVDNERRFFKTVLRYREALMVDSSSKLNRLVLESLVDYISYRYRKILFNQMYDSISKDYCKTYASREDDTND